MSRRLAASIAAGATVVATATALNGTATGAARTATPAARTAATGTTTAQALAARSADTLVASHPTFLSASQGEQYVRGTVASSSGTQYVPYERTYSGIPVVGGDFVIVTNAAGQVEYHSVAQRHAIGHLTTTPVLTSAKAASVASGQLHSHVVAHEMGHGIDDHTPGGISGNGTQEFIADTYGASTEFFLNEPAPYATPDFLVGDQINLVGSGPIRNMDNPSLINGDPNCYDSSIPSAEVHAAAGPGNHWFYLLAEGSDPVGGPVSPTCDNSPVTGGVGVENAIKIVYNAQLMKNSASDYPSLS